MEAQLARVARDFLDLHSKASKSIAIIATTVSDTIVWICCQIGSIGATSLIIGVDWADVLVLDVVTVTSASVV